MKEKIARLQKRRGRQKLIFAVLLALLALLLFAAGQAPAEARAVTKEEEAALEELCTTVDELISTLDTEELQQFLDSLRDFGGISVKDKLAAVVTGNYALDYSSILSAALAFVWEEGRTMIPAFAMILAIALLCGILNSAKNSFLQSTTSDIIHFVSYISVGAVVLACLLGVLESGLSAISNMQRQMEIVYPLLLTLMAASGGSVSVGIYRPAVAFMSGGITKLFTSVVIPSAIIVIVLTFVGNMTENVRTGRLADLFKSVSGWLIGLTLGLFSIFLTVQGIASAQYDGLSLRAIKYVISGSVPIVGGFLSGGVELVVAGSALIKNALGGFAIFLLVGTLLRPVLLFVAFQLFLRIAAAATEPVGGKISLFLSSLARDSGYFLAALLSVAFLYFLTIILLVSSTGAIF